MDALSINWKIENYSNSHCLDKGPKTKKNKTYIDTVMPIYGSRFLIPFCVKIYNFLTIWKLILNGPADSQSVTYLTRKPGGFMQNCFFFLYCLICSAFWCICCSISKIQLILYHKPPQDMQFFVRTGWLKFEKLLFSWISLINMSILRCNMPMIFHHFE